MMRGKQFPVALAMIQPEPFPGSFRHEGKSFEEIIDISLNEIEMIEANGFDGYIIQTDHSDIKAMTAEIQKIGVNVNQIAKRVNATGSVYQEDIEEIKGVLAEIWRLQRLSLLKAL